MSGLHFVGIFLCIVHITCTTAADVSPFQDKCEAANNRLDAIENEMKLFKMKEENFQQQHLEDAGKIRQLEKMVMVQQTASVQQNSRVVALEATLRNLTASQSVGNSKRLVLGGEEGQVGFSAYLDHDMDGVGNKQKILFNQLLFNDGVAYSAFTGVFTCPQAGVYLFIYFVGNRHDREVDAELVVNGDMQNEAVAEGVQSAHDTQGGNSAILRLAVGDKVWVDTTLGSHVEGQWRFTSFSGVLLYPQ